MGLKVIRYNVADDRRTWWQRVVLGYPRDVQHVGPNIGYALQVANEQNRQHSEKWHGRIGAIHFPRKPKPVSTPPATH